MSCPPNYCSNLNRPTLLKITDTVQSRWRKLPLFRILFYESLKESFNSYFIYASCSKFYSPAKTTFLGRDCFSLWGLVDTWIGIEIRRVRVRRWGDLNSWHHPSQLLYQLRCYGFIYKKINKKHWTWSTDRKSHFNEDEDKWSIKEALQSLLSAIVY